MALSPSASYKSHYQNFTPPFDIPDSWEWVRLMDCCHIAGRIGFRGYTKDDLVSKDAGAITLSPSNIVNGSMQYDLCTYISWHKYYESPEIQVWEKDILLVKTGSSYGKCALVERLPKEATINPQYVVLKHVAISPEYLTYVLQSNYAKECYEQFVLGTAIPTFTQEKLGNLAVPLPPLYEQVRIVKTIKKYLNLIGILDSEVQSLSNEISHAKSKILDLAMQGKLVPQDPADEPATDMLRRINPNAKIITDNPHSWNIPNGWCWVMVSDVFAPMQRKLPEGDNFWYIDIDSVDNKRNVAYPKNICTTTAPSRASRFTQKGDVVFSMVRPYLRNIALVPEDDCIASTGFYVFHPLDAILSKYSYILTLSSFFVDGLNSFMKGDNSPSINKNNVESFVIPLPPLNEQKRIVAKIEDLYSVLDEIEASLRS